MFEVVLIIIDSQDRRCKSDACHLPSFVLGEDGIFVFCFVFLLFHAFFVNFFPLFLFSVFVFLKILI